MTFIALKEKLHEYIEQADEKKVTAIYTLVEDEIEGTGFVYDEETLDMLDQRVEDYQNGKIKGQTAEESMEWIRTQLSKNGS